MQDQQERESEGERVGLLSSDRVAGLVLMGCGLTVICTLLVLIVSNLLTSGDGPRATGSEFAVFRAAGQLVIEGGFLRLFDTDRLTAIHNVASADAVPWLYPPAFLCLLALSGAVSVATGLKSGAGHCASFRATVRRRSGPCRLGAR